MTTWIPVEERLPDNYTDVLVYNKSGFQHVAHYNAPNFLYKTHGYKSILAEGHKQVTYWMPLPPAPRP